MGFLEVLGGLIRGVVLFVDIFEAISPFVFCVVLPFLIVFLDVLVNGDQTSGL